MQTIVPVEIIERKILLIKGQKVMLSSHLAELYAVETRALNQAVKRNINRFPEDFMFQLTESETEQLVSQTVIPHRKYVGGSMPYAFTEQGVAMLSTNKELAYKLAQLERKIEKHDGEIKLIFDAIRQLMIPPETKKKRIGFGRESE